MHIDEFIDKIPQTRLVVSNEMEDFNRMLSSLTRAYNNKDAGAFVAHFADDAIIRGINRRFEIEGRNLWPAQSQRIIAAHHWMKLDAFPISP